MQGSIEFDGLESPSLQRQMKPNHLFNVHRTESNGWIHRTSPRSRVVVFDVELKLPYIVHTYMAPIVIYFFFVQFNKNSKSVQESE